MGRAYSQKGGGEGRRAFKILTGKLTGKRPLGRPRLRWENNIGMDPLSEKYLNKINETMEHRGCVKQSDEP